MPGKKSLSKMEKTQDEVPEKKEEKKKEKIIGSVDALKADSPEFIDALRKMKAITPPAVSSQFNLKVSISKRMLEELEDNGRIKQVTHTNNLKVYTILQKN